MDELDGEKKMTMMLDGAKKVGEREGGESCVFSHTYTHTLPQTRIRIIGKLFCTLSHLYTITRRMMFQNSIHNSTTI